MTRAASFWNAVYDNDTAPWVIGEPQPAIVALAQSGRIRGRVLEPGCGAGEHTILLTRLGYDVLGVDVAPSAVEYARRNAVAQGVSEAKFEVADALRLGERAEWAGETPAFDTVLDSALFHVFGTDEQARTAYVAGLHAVLKPGGLVHLLALSDAEPGIGPRISDAVILDSFGDGWELEELAATRYRGRISAEVAAEIPHHPVSDGIADFAAWQARIRRV
ncbi:class I SAM-dependent methyltransferase [Nocardia sp. NPDC052566]|uniref:class I SAM-dependent methyltransferase n=1 Tax=Nocardia sp. NPDC052566 TaxID=3364330 RepID=UPI0037CB5016